MAYTRSEFLKLSALSGIAILGASPLNGMASPLPDATKKLHLGMASYTLRNFKIDDVIRITKLMGLESISLKSMHLPLESTAEEIHQVTTKVRSAGLNLYGAGVIYMKTQKEVEAAFAYAKAAGLAMIIGVPNHDLLPLVNEQVKKYDIQLAIHNHGPGDTLYTSPSDVYNKVKDLDKRIGLCIDIGHVIRIGQDPVEMIQKYKDRLYDIHMKDESKASADGEPIEIGHGVIDIPGVLKALVKANYAGQVAFEFEKLGDEPVAGLAESIGYVRGVLKMIA